MKIAYCSDLHLDFGVSGLFEMDLPIADVFVIAGDLIEVINMSRSPLSSLYHMTQNFQTFMSKVCSYYKTVLYVPGNHEFYGSVMPDALLKMHLLKDTYPNLIVMDNLEVKIEDVSFFGGTMWTDFDKQNPLALIRAETGMLDYDKIKMPGYSRLKTGHVLQCHIRFKQCLESFLATSATKRVVVSHHAPTELCVNDRWKNDSLNPAFYANMDEYLYNDQIDVWIHGHMHDPVDIVCGSCRILCNPRGYEGHEWKQTNNFRFEVVEV